MEPQRIVHDEGALVGFLNLLSCSAGAWALLSTSLDRATGRLREKELVALKDAAWPFVSSNNGLRKDLESPKKPTVVLSYCTLRKC